MLQRCNISKQHHESQQASLGDKDNSYKTVSVGYECMSLHNNACMEVNLSTDSLMSHDFQKAYRTMPQRSAVEQSISIEGCGGET